MDAFRKISGLLHDLLPSPKDTVDRVLAAKSYDYWNSYVLGSLGTDPCGSLISSAP